MFPKAKPHSACPTTGNSSHLTTCGDPMGVHLLYSNPPMQREEMEGADNQGGEEQVDQ